MIESELINSWSALHNAASEDVSNDSVIAKAWENGEMSILSYVLLLLAS